jgi:hypothetical protein
MKAKNTPVANATPAVAFDATPVSFKDAAYKSAALGESIATIAAWVYTKCPNFTSEVPKEIKAELTEGWALRWQELNPAKTYNSLKGWIPDEKGDIQATLAWALSYSQQAFGQLKKDDPHRHDIMGDLRTKFNKYASNKLADMKRAVRNLENANKPRERIQAKLFMTYLEDTFADMKKRCKTAKARSDAEAIDEVKLRMAIEAFYNVLNK